MTINKNIRIFIRKIVEDLLPSFWFSNSYYSQDGEDILLSTYLDIKKKDGFFIDVGAHHPFRFSNTALFYKNGWKGINIEPTPNLIQKFKKHRKRDINLPIGVGPQKDVITFYEFDEPALNSFDQKLSEHRDMTTAYSIINQRKIKVDQLAAILDQHLPPNQLIDFLSIDAEGFDYAILQSNDWEKYRPSCVVVESEYETPFLESKTHKYLSKLNYSLVGKTKRSAIYKNAL